jgi:acyl-CoA synthetase (AMP-forming)/AMP-acid ligase II/pimeloyl-ACP methyl ester carboxylesterase
MGMVSADWQELWPYQPRWFENQGFKQHYVDEGEGEPVVMLHGNPTWGFYFRRLIRALKPHFRVIVPDHIGCGLSAKPAADAYPYTLESRVDDLERLLEDLNIKEGVTLLVHDWGGMIGMTYAARHPERIKRLIVLNTGAFHLPADKAFPWPLWVARTRLGAWLIRAGNAFCRVAAWTCTTRRPLPAAVQAGLLAPYDSWDNRVATLRFVQDIPLHPRDPGYKLISDTQAALAKFKDTPALICWGMRDWVFDKSFLREWRHYLPHASVYAFADSGHYVLEDAGAEIEAAVKDFLQVPGGRVNIAQYLPAEAANHPQTWALAHRDERWNFKKLEEESNRCAHALLAQGIRRGMRTVLMVPPSLDFFALTFALFKIGAVPVLVDPGMGTANLKQCLAEAQPEAFIGVPKAHLARLLLGWARQTLRINLYVGLSRLRAARTTLHIERTRADETAAILFTSGSTGVPKGAVYTHGNFDAQIRILRKEYGIKPGEVDLPTFPLFALFAPALGMSSVIPEMDFTRPADVDPAHIVDLVRRYEPTQMFGSPALLDRVGRYLATHNIKLPSLRRVLSAGAPVPAAVLERFLEALSPEAEIYTPYGATEALPVCSIGAAEILKETRNETEKGAGVCVGKPVEEAEVRVIRITDTPIAEWDEHLVLAPGEIGEIVVKGAVATHKYFNRPAATKLAKIQDPQGGFYHRMGDLGYFDGKGRLWFCGRKSHRVGTGSGELYTVSCEGVFNTHTQVKRTALVGVAENGHKKPVLCVELTAGVPDGEPRKKILRELLAIGSEREHTRGIKTILIHEGHFPVDIRHNAKIFREKLALWAAERLV